VTTAPTTTPPATTPPRPLALHGLSWVTWRQHRAALLGVVALFGSLGALMVGTGLPMHRAWTSLGLSACPDPSSRACSASYAVFTARWEVWAQFLPRFLEFLPLVVGVFVGAPLIARELESGTFRFAWTQGRDRVRWTAGKLLLLGAAVTLPALAFSALFSWWFGPWFTLMGRMAGGQAYEITGIVFAARTLFAFTLGALLGAVIRRTVPAMAATAAGWLAVAWPSVLWLRPHILPPLVVPESALTGPLQDWTISSWYQDTAGHHLSDGQLVTLARQANGVSDRNTFTSWLDDHGYTQWASYQPDSRFWHFQTVETGAYVLLSLALAAATIQWVRRRAS
jgi:hypothetical protein